MKLLWLCNLLPSAVRESAGKKPGSGLWMDSVLDGLRQRENVTVKVICQGSEDGEGKIDDRLSYLLFRNAPPHRARPELNARFEAVLKDFQPDVIHIWGTEYPHTLAMLQACENLDMLDRTAVSIQGLCHILARHYTEGLLPSVCRSFTFRDLLRWDNISLQQRKFALRGKNEKKALRLARHVIGRTEFDLACTGAINPERIYHICNETLRPPFYSGQWRYDTCKHHRIFASGCSYPIKGFHYLLEAAAQVSKQFPDVTIAVPGESYLDLGGKERLRQGGYARYLAKRTRELGLEDRIEFLGSLSPEQMKETYLGCNVFVLPSTNENSPNSLGEAMLLGVPCVAADVGGVTTLLEYPWEGYVYPSSAPYLLAHYVEKVFSMGVEAEELGRRAQKHARRTHDPEKNMSQLLEIYRELEGVPNGKNP